MADDRRRGAYEFSLDQQAHLGVVIVATMLFLIYEATHGMAKIDRVEMAGLGTVSVSSQLPAANADDGAAGGGDVNADGDQLTAEGTSLLPLAAATSHAGLVELVGQSAVARGVPVLSVTADEGF